MRPNIFWLGAASQPQTTVSNALRSFNPNLQESVELFFLLVYERDPPASTAGDDHDTIILSSDYRPDHLPSILSIPPW